MFYSTQKEVKSHNIGRTFFPLFPRFYKGFIKTVRQSVILIGFTAVPSPDVNFIEDERLKDGRTAYPSE